MEDVKTPFKKGNPWRFTADTQPQRHITANKAVKMLEALLSSTHDGVISVANDAEAPVFLKSAAIEILEGNTLSVVELINAYRHGIQ